jgi:ABC-type branched-subunit amino acid transport system ATPase component
MFTESVTLQNFRCFGPDPTTVTLGADLIALIGANGAGKTAFIEALRRLFGVTREERTLARADVHFGPDEKPETVESREIVIDVVFAFPELRDGSPDATLTVPEVFRIMTASGPGAPLKARSVWKLYGHGAKALSTRSRPRSIGFQLSTKLSLAMLAELASINNRLATLTVARFN